MKAVARNGLAAISIAWPLGTCASQAVEPSRAPKAEERELRDAARVSGRLFAVVDEGALAWFDERTLQEVGVRSFEPPLAWIAGTNDDLLAVDASGRVMDIDPDTWDAETAGEIEGRPLWIGARSGCTVVVADGREGSGRTSSVLSLPSGQRFEVDVGADAALLDGEGRLWLGSDRGEWGGRIGVLDLSSGRVEFPRDARERGARGPKSETRYPAQELPVYGFTELADGTVLVFGGLEHLGAKWRYVYAAEGDRLRLVWPPGAVEGSERSPGPRRPILALVDAGRSLLAVTGDAVHRTDRTFRDWELVHAFSTEKAYPGWLVDAYPSHGEPGALDLALADGGWLRIHGAFEPR